jgi:hydrogenase/urease accessory protein HupE
MSSLFEINLKLGFTHILDPKAYDHLLFIIALVAIYKLSEWRKVGLLVTAFTIGHSITLALSALEIITFRKDIIEILIPVTILITAIYNGFIALSNKTTKPQNMQVNYSFAMFFGLIHGMAFSNQLKASIFPGEESKVFIQLLGFNLGIELGQLLIVLIILFVSIIAFNFLKINQRWWIMVLSLIVAIFAGELLYKLL